MSRSRAVALGVAVPLALFGLIQLVPFGRQHEVPPSGTPVNWDSPRTRELAQRACFDCHSNETKWPWYSNIAPLSWRIQAHVNEGREKLNFTAFEPGNQKVADAAGEASEEVTKGAMPLRDYLLMHPEARLSAAEKQELVRGLEATFVAFAEKGERRGAGEGNESGEREAEEEHERERR